MNLQKWREPAGGERRVREHTRGENDRGTSYACMAISKWNPLFHTTNMLQLITEKYLKTSANWYHTNTVKKMIKMNIYK